MAFIRFGSGGRSYAFPGATLHASSDTFASLAPQTTPLPGLSGGFDFYGVGPAPAVVGQIQLSFTLVALTRSEMTAKRDAVRAMARWGVQRLWKQPTDPDDPERFCFARVASISMPEQHGGQTDLHQPVTVTFQAADPRWYSKENLWYLDGSLTLDGGRTVQGAAAVEVEDGDIITVTNAGTAPTPPRIQIEPVASGDWITEWFIGDPYVIGMEGLFIGEAPDAAVQGFGLRRLSEDGRVQSEWFWLGTVREGEQLIVDHAACRVRHESTAGSLNGYPDFYATVGFAFPPLEPGENRFQVFGTFTGKVRLTIDFLDAWI